MLIYCDENRMFQNGFRRYFAVKNYWNCNLDNSYILLLVHSTILIRKQATFGQRSKCMRNWGGLRTRNSKYFDAFAKILIPHEKFTR